MGPAARDSMCERSVRTRFMVATNGVLEEMYITFSVLLYGEGMGA